MNVIVRGVCGAVKLCAVLGGLIIAAAIIVNLAAEQMDGRRAKAAETVDAPDILIDHPALLDYPDPLHVKLPDGQTFRLAHLLAPPPGTPEYAAALDEVNFPLASGGNRLRGLRVVGTSDDGEILVELWGFHASLGGCGNSSWSERRAARIPRWNSLTWQLVSAGLFFVDPQSTDPELRRWEDAARRDQRGLWANSDFLPAGEELHKGSMR